MWDLFFALRGTPSKVVSDQGKQLTSSSNAAAFSNKENPESWNWKELEEAGAKSGTKWEFVAAGCQFRNGLAEARVKATKQMLEHMLTTAVNGGKPVLSYAELQTLLTKIANIINDRPIGIQGLTEDEMGE